MLIEKRPISDHILVASFPTAKEKGDVCVFGSLKGFSDYKTVKDAPGSVDVGKAIAVFQAAKADVTGTIAIGTDVYLTSAGVLTATGTGNSLFGTVVAIGADTLDIAITG